MRKTQADVTPQSENERKASLEPNRLPPRSVTLKGASGIDQNDNAVLGAHGGYDLSKILSSNSVVATGDAPMVHPVQSRYSRRSIDNDLAII